MSTKSSIIYTASEHWYRDCNGAFSEGTSTEECIVLEFGQEHTFEVDQECARVIIKEGTPLFQAIRDLAAPRYSRGPAHARSLDPMDELIARFPNQPEFQTPEQNDAAFKTVLFKTALVVSLSAIAAWALLA